jgi:signal transduction histidine kinase
VSVPPEEAERRLDRPRALALYRILQEALTNVVRHAGAQRVVVRLELAQQAAILTVHDDGHGVTPAQVESGTALGVLGMRERALLFGGGVTVVGEPGTGTTVTVHIPLGGETAEASA